MVPSRHAAWAAGLSLLAGAAAPAAPAAAFQGPWAPPANLSASGRDAGSAQVAVAADGTAIAVWRRSNGRSSIVQASTRPPGGRFGRPVNLSAPGQSAYDLRLAVAANGIATAVWRAGTAPNRIVQASTRPPGGRFGAPVGLSARGQDGYAPQVGAARDGTITVVWREASTVGGALTSRARTRPPGGQFGAPADVSAPSQEVSPPKLAVAPDGTTTVFSQHFTGQGDVLQASTRPPGGAFGDPVSVAFIGPGPAPRLQVATAADGTTTVVWREHGVQASTRPPGAAFGPAAVLAVDFEGAIRDGSGPRVAVAPDGTTTVVWSVVSSEGATYTAQAATRRPGRSFGAAIRLAAGPFASAPQVASGADGTTTAVWPGFNGTSAVVQARTRPPGGAFGAPVTVSVGPEYASDPQVAVAPDGAAVAVWRRFNGTNFIVQAAVTAGPPAPRRPPTIAGSPRVGRTLRCAGSAWTGAASVTTAWLRGGAVIAAGPAHRVTAADRGAALACRRRAASQYGTTDSRSRAVRIPPGPPIPPPAPAPAPAARSLPAITGTPRIGRTLRCRPGAFTGATSTSTSWLRGTRTIPGAPKTTYSLTRTDAGKAIACRTTATGTGGTSTTISLRTRARP